MMMSIMGVKILKTFGGKKKKTIFVVFFTYILIGLPKFKVWALVR